MEKSGLVTHCTCRTKAQEQRTIARIRDRDLMLEKLEARRAQQETLGGRAERYMHEGKEVVKFAGVSFFTPGCGSVMCYADGTFEESGDYDAFDSLIEESGFVVYRGQDHDRYYGGECFEAIPIEDHDTADWEYVEAGDVPLRGTGRSMNGGYSGWRRKGEEGQRAGYLTVKALRDGP